MLIYSFKTHLPPFPFSKFHFLNLVTSHAYENPTSILKKSAFRRKDLFHLLLPRSICSSKQPPLHILNNQGKRKIV